MKRGIVPVLLLLILGCFTSSKSRSEAKKLAEELFKHPEITELDDCTRSHKYLNGIRIILSKDTTKQDQSGNENEPKYYKEVLEQEGVSEKDFEYFKNRLEETELRHYYRKGNYSVFFTGGMFGEVEGILVVHENATVPEDGFHLNEYYYLWIGKAIERNVYLISGA